MHIIRVSGAYVETLCEGPGEPELRKEKDLKKCGIKCRKTLDFLGKVGYNNKRRLKRLKHVRP